jgi:hypothetical protein
MPDETQALTIENDNSYNKLLADLRAIIASGRGRAATAVNAEMVATYWQIGERIVREEQGARSAPDMVNDCLHNSVRL